ARCAGRLFSCLPGRAALLPPRSRPARQQRCARADEQLHHRHPRATRRRARRARARARARGRLEPSLAGLCAHDRRVGRRATPRKPAEADARLRARPRGPVPGRRVTSMCGIYGEIAAPGSSPEMDVLARMAARLEHRGPDDGNAVRLGAAALGCRRLAIIDVPGGRQPLANERGDVIAVCNGEIYNHARLRHDLEARGHPFRTRSDAEVIPHLYEESGPDLVDALDGMFALAVWDAPRGRLLLARDRLGEKPLYYAAGDGAFVFASEPKALLASGRVAAEPDWSAPAGSRSSGWVRSPRSGFAAIACLPPGGRLVLEGERLRIDRYWTPRPFLAGPATDIGLDDAAVALRSHLEHAVRAALISDVPI